MKKREVTSHWECYVLRWPTSVARDWAMDVLPQLCQHPSVLAVVALGSTVRPAESSFDFDCLYVYRGLRPDMPASPIEVDLRAFEFSQVDSLISDGNDLLVWSLRLGRMLCERDSYWSRLKESWESRLPFPSAAVAEKRAERADTILADLRRVGDSDAIIDQQVAVLTHRARAALLRKKVFPASRPELPAQLRAVGERVLAGELEVAIRERNALAHSSPTTM